MPHVPDTVPGKRVPGAGARTEGRGQPSNIRGGSRMQESCTYGSMRGAPSNGRPYRNRCTLSYLGKADRHTSRRLLNPAAESVRNRLSAGGNRIRTLGPPAMASFVVGPRSLLRRAGGGEIGTAVQPDFSCSASHSIEPGWGTV